MGFSVPLLGAFSIAVPRRQVVPSHQAHSPKVDWFENRRFFTGPKASVFPTSLDDTIDSYPDVTEHFIRFREEAVHSLEGVRLNSFPLVGRIKRFWTLGRQFPTGQALDTKFHREFPGRTKTYQVQYAAYKGKVVSANYLANNFFGQVMAALGYPLWFAKLASHVESADCKKALYEGRLLSLNTRKDLGQLPIESGYADYFRNEPWTIEGLDPTLPHNKRRKKVQSH